MTHEAVMPEICCEVLPAYRRQGCAREAVPAMFGWSQVDPAVLRFRATGSPENLASRFCAPDSGSSRSAASGTRRTAGRPSSSSPPVRSHGDPPRLGTAFLGKNSDVDH